MVSVLAQTSINAQVVIVDDGSTDETAQVIDSIADGNEKVHILHKENGGVSSARNKGIQYVLSISRDCDYIAFLDADDAWEKNFFDQAVLNIIDKGTDLIGFQSAVCNNELTMRAQTVNLAEGQFWGGRICVDSCYTTFWSNVIFMWIFEKI